MKDLKKFPIVLIFLIAVIFRIWLISDNHIYFWFDQARDASISQEIILNRDLKIQGPSASGTNDTIYHGVLYYYVLGPLYILANGNPYLVAIIIGCINSISILLLYLLTKMLFESHKIALLAAMLLAINFEHAEYSTWLSNPTMGLIPILVFIIAVWKIFYTKTKDKIKFWLILMSLSLGVIEQSAFYSLYFFGVIFISLWFLYKANNKHFKSIVTVPHALLFFAIYGMTISTMIINQYLLYQAGIFSLSNIREASSQSSFWTNPQLLLQLPQTYMDKISRSLTPNYFYTGIFFLTGIIWTLIYKVSSSARWLLIAWLTAPLWLFIISFRNSPHMLFGLEYVLLIILALLISTLLNKNKFVLKFCGFSIISLYLLLQVNAVIEVRAKDTSIFTFQKGVMLTNELRLIDRTYEVSQAQPFSISVWGSPYEYYITWAYLYDWYGKNKYGYVPSYFGTSQEGKFGDYYLEQKNEPEKIHFLIEEPDLFLVGDIYQDYISNQNDSTTVIKTDLDNDDFEKFGEYRLQSRQKIEDK